METEIVKKEDMPNRRAGKSPYNPLLEKYKELPNGKVLKIKVDNFNRASTLYHFFKRYKIKIHIRELPDALYVFAPKQ